MVKIHQTSVTSTGRHPTLQTIHTNMKSIIATCIASFLLLLPALASEADLKNVTAAYDARLAATLSVDKDGLGKVLSDELHYAHSTGVVDTKAAFIDTLVTGKNKYVKMEYLKRDFTFPAPTIALMSGQIRIKTDSPTKGVNEFTLSYLAVWKNENGAWRFHAWQSARLPEPAPAN